ncbi:MAG: hypothetical protein WCG06_01810, partial [Candidatus Omnitrophota bacterium]
MKKAAVLLFLAALVTVTLPAAAEDAGTDQAKKLFTQYVELEKKHDSKLTELYADDALIEGSQKAADGSISKATLKGNQYKIALSKVLLPMASKQKDANRYSDTRYSAVENGQVRITTQQTTQRPPPATPPGPGAGGLRL